MEESQQLGPSRDPLFPHSGSFPSYPLNDQGAAAPCPASQRPWSQESLLIMFSLQKGAEERVGRPQALSSIPSFLGYGSRAR